MPIQWISNDRPNPEYITIDTQQRLYLSAGTAALIGLAAGQHAKLLVGYDAVNRRIIVAKPDVVRMPKVRPFNFDLRRYTYGKPFVRELGLADDLPLHFNFVGKDYADSPKGSYAFQLEDTDAPDDEGRG